MVVIIICNIQMSIMVHTKMAIQDIFNGVTKTTVSKIYIVVHFSTLIGIFILCKVQFSLKYSYYTLVCEFQVYNIVI